MPKLLKRQDAPHWSDRQFSRALEGDEPLDALIVDGVSVGEAQRARARAHNLARQQAEHEEQLVRARAALAGLTVREWKIARALALAEGNAQHRPVKEMRSC